MADRIIQLTDKNGDKVYPIGVAGLPPAMDLVNIFYPVGSIYTSIEATFDPNTAWGGTWEKIAAGKFLEATETAADVGTSVAAGLPNVTAQPAANVVCHQNASQGSGALRYIYGGSAPVCGTTSIHFGQFSLDLSKGNSIYGNSTTVQPESIKVFIWKRIA